MPPYEHKMMKSPSGARRRQDTTMTLSSGQQQEVSLMRALVKDELFELVPRAIRMALSQQDGAPFQTWGEQFIQSLSFKSYVPGTLTPMDVKTVTGYAVQAALNTSRTATGRRLNLLDLIRVIPIASASVRAPSVGAITDASDVYDSNQLIAESDIQFSEDEQLTRIISTYIRASRQILMDAPQAREIVDTELTYMVRKKLEQQIVAGDGTGTNLLGILNWPDVPTRDGASPRAAVGESAATRLRRAVTDIQLEGYEPNGIAMNPVDAETVMLEGENAAWALTTFDADGTARPLPIVPVIGMPAGTAVPGAFDIGATVYDQQDVEIHVGYPNDFEIRNMVALLADMRATFAVNRPLAFRKVTLP